MVIITLSIMIQLISIWIFSQGWSSAYTVEAVIVQIAATLVKGKARINFKENKVCLVAMNRVISLTTLLHC